MIKITSFIHTCMQCATLYEYITLECTYVVCVYMYIVHTCRLVINIASCIHVQCACIYEYILCIIDVHTYTCACSEQIITCTCRVCKVCIYNIPACTGFSQFSRNIPKPFHHVHVHVHMHMYWYVVLCNIYMYMYCVSVYSAL